jgi:nucleolar protein 4
VKASIHRPKTPVDPLAIRTIVISSLPPAIESKTLWKKVRKQDGAEKLVFPAPNLDSTTDPTVAHVIFGTPSQAQSAVEHLHAHIFKGALLSAVLKKRLEKPPNRSSRLIIRNLPWNITEQELRAMFLSHGPVYSVDIPKEKGEPPSEEESSPSKSQGPKAKGFAFVWMLSRGDAENALQEINGKKIGGRPIAVDWALSKERWEGEKGRFEEEAKNKDIDAKEPESVKEDSDSDEASGEDGLGVHEDDADSITERSEGSVDEDGGDRGEPIKPQLPQTDTGTTIFIRNVPYEATEDELRIL